MVTRPQGAATKVQTLASPAGSPADAAASRCDGPTVAMLTGVGVVFGRTPVLRRLDVTLHPGEVLGVAGPNGSGKSTLLQVMATLLAPTEGWGHVLGAPLGSRSCRLVRPRIGLVGQESGLYPQLTLLENLRYIARLLGRPDGAALHALEDVGLLRAAHRRAEHCSHGMWRRAELARMLLVDPVLLLLDEPHTGLDRQAVTLVEAVVGRVRGRGGAGVLVSHDGAQLRALADRVVEVDGGRLVPSDLAGPAAAGHPGGRR